MIEETSPRRTRLIARKGLEFVAIRITDIACIYTEQKIVYVVDRTGTKYIGEQNLSQLEGELDNNLFFRANRQFIININFVRGYKPVHKVKLQVALTLPDLQQPIIISQETAPIFRNWIYNA